MQNFVTRTLSFSLNLILMFCRKFLTFCRLFRNELISDSQILFHRLFENDIPPIKAWCKFSQGHLTHRNWGDDINKFFFEEITGKKILLYPDRPKFFQSKNILAIGSVITHLNKRSIVWGSGLINNVRHSHLSTSPRKILAVRGPLTRQWLLDQNIPCPAVYGDPALLLPLFYEPRRLPRPTNDTNAPQIGIIAHHADLKHPNQAIQNLLQNDNTHLIRTSGYAHWHDFIDEITSCDFILSASLHGLIVSEAYCIPCAWVEFCGHIPGWDFKFLDFYAAIGKPQPRKLSLSTTTRHTELLPLRDIWQQGHFDFRPLLNSSPLPINPASIIEGNMTRYIYSPLPSCA